MNNLIKIKRAKFNNKLSKLQPYQRKQLTLVQYLTGINPDFITEYLDQGYEYIYEYK